MCKNHTFTQNSDFIQIAYEYIHTQLHTRCLHLNDSGKQLPFTNNVTVKYKPVKYGDIGSVPKSLNDIWALMLSSSFTFSCSLSREFMGSYGSWVNGFIGSWVHGFICSLVHGFIGS